MLNQWSDNAAAEFSTAFRDSWGEDLALRTYASRLIGAEPGLVLHGGGNTSVKTSVIDVLGRPVPALCVKASGHDLKTIGPEGHTGLRLEYLQRLKKLDHLSDDVMVNEMRTHLFDAGAATPSIEALLHAFIPEKFIDHTHADVILALTNRPDGEQIVREALGDDVIILDYILPGFDLARAAAEAYAARPQAKGMVLMKHGLISWGDTARQSYDATLDLANRAEAWLEARLEQRAVETPAAKQSVSVEEAKERYARFAPMLRGLLAADSGNPDDPHDRFILRPLINGEVLHLLDSERAGNLLDTPPLTSDHLIRTKPWPLWMTAPRFDDERALKEQILAAIATYADHYKRYYDRETKAPAGKLARFDAMPRVILMPGLGAVCAGKDVVEAEIVRDITRQTLDVKAKIAATGEYEGLAENHLFGMEYRSLQHAKLGRGQEPALRRKTALVTGAAGAIGSGICRELLKNGCHLAASDLDGDRLEALIDELRVDFGERIIGVGLDVTDRQSVSKGFERMIECWGGVDLIVVNAGIAHVSTLEDMDIEAFRRLERVNIEGALNILSEAAAHLRIQGTGGDIVLISTKNVPAPGATFGAYSATKAAAHQLARIASLEMAEIGVRVNMVAPDAVFGGGSHRSGLWAEVGPGRMRARGLDEKGLEEYYRNRNLLKSRVTAGHVARAVMYFATRQTPTTGATIPVDGGLPDATPR